jgi:hypothetical protein
MMFRSKIYKRIIPRKEYSGVYLRDNSGQNTWNYLLHQIHNNSRHPKFLDRIKVGLLSIQSP